MAMKNIETKIVPDIQKPEDKTLSLHITGEFFLYEDFCFTNVKQCSLEILENITNVSSTFTKHRPVSEVEMSRSNKVRIHIIGDV